MLWANIGSFQASLVAQLVKNPAALQETQEDPLEKEMAAHPSILAWRIHGQSPWWATVHGVAMTWQLNHHHYQAVSLSQNLFSWYTY